MPEATPQLTPPKAPQFGGEAANIDTDASKSAATSGTKGGNQPPKLTLLQGGMGGGGWLDSEASELGNAEEGQEAEADMYSQRQADKRARLMQAAEQDIQIKRMMNEQGISFEKNATDMAAGAAEQAGEKYGRELNARIKTGDFKYFFIAIILALIADGWNIVDEFLDAGLISTAISIFIDAAMFALLWGEGTWFKRQIIRMLIWPLIAVAVSEFIPIINFFPDYTIGVVLMEMAALRELMKNKGALQLLTENMAITGKGKAERDQEMKERMSRDTYQYGQASRQTQQQSEIGAGEGGNPPKIEGAQGEGGGAGEAPPAAAMEAA